MSNINNDDVSSYDAYLKYRLEFIRKHSMYGSNINEVDIKIRQKEIDIMYQKQNKFLNTKENNDEEN